MDFGSLLHEAQKNEQLPKKEIKYYSTKFEPPKKQERSKQLSVNIKKFLARKEAEEKQKALEAKLEKEKLLALRSQDKKAQRRIQVMLKRTKSANKSVIQDAIDQDNTAVTLAGPSQPDEDDYGYVSQEASAFYNKIMAKYNNMPEEPKFSSHKKNTNINLSGTKDRVKAALLKEQEEALLPHKRKRKHKDSETNESYNEDVADTQTRIEEKPISKPKPKLTAPPPMNFAELLKIAEKKQFEPIKIEPKKELKEEERPMTKKQKKEYEKELAWRERKEKGLTMSAHRSPETTQKSSGKLTPPPNKISKLSTSSSSAGKIPKLSNPEDRSKIVPKSSNPVPSTIKKDKERQPNDVQSQSSMQRKPDPSKLEKIKSENRDIRDVNRPPVNKPLISRPQNVNHMHENRPSDKAQISKPISKINTLDKNKNIKKEVTNKDKFKQPLQVKPKQFPPADLKQKTLPPKQFPPKDLKSKQFTPPDVGLKQFPRKDVKRKLPMGHKRRILDDDSEYDSEMDDFIDDGPEDAQDYSKYISEIFGYDKSKYRHNEDDDGNMESSFSQMMKEEFISSKIGLLEDLEDMRKEAEEKRRKATTKKERK